MKNPHGRHAITGASAFRPCTLPDTSSRRVEPEKTEIQQATPAAATTHSSIKGQIPICFPTQEKVHRWTATVCVRSKKASRSSAEQQQQQQQLHLEPLAFAFALIRSFVRSCLISLRQERRGNLLCNSTLLPRIQTGQHSSSILFSHY